MKPKEYAIDWNRDGQNRVRDLRDGVPVETWETHVIEKSAYDDVLAKIERLKGAAESRCRDIDQLDKEIRRYREALGRRHE